MSLEMAHKVILPPKKNYIPQFLKQRDINSYSMRFNYRMVTTVTVHTAQCRFRRICTSHFFKGVANLWRGTIRLWCVRTEYSAHQRVLVDFQRTRLSCGSMIRLLAHPLSPSAICLSFSAFLCAAGQACWRERGGGGDGRGAKSSKPEKAWPS